MYTAFVVAISLLFIVLLVLTYGSLNLPEPKESDIKFKTPLAGCLYPVLLLPTFIILSFIVRSWAIVTLWTWFVTPQFNITAPSQAMAYGLALLASSFTAIPKMDKIETKTDYTGLFITPIVYILGLVGFGWVVHTFLM